jgi:hypothetical protein
MTQSDPPDPSFNSLLATLPWVKSLDPEDLQTFLTEMTPLYAQALATRDKAAFNLNLEAWEITAEQMAEPGTRTALLGASRPEEYAEVSRPRLGPA